MADKNIQMQRKKADGTYDVYHPLTKVENVAGAAKQADLDAHLAEKASSNDFGHVKIGSGLDVQDGLVSVSDTFLNKTEELDTALTSHLAEKASSNDFGHVKIGSGLDVQDGLVSVSDTFLKGVFDVGDKIVALDTTLVDTNSGNYDGVVLKTFRTLASGRVLVSFIGQNTAEDTYECHLWIVKTGSAPPPVEDQIIITYNETLNIEVELDVTNGEQYQLRGRLTYNTSTKHLRVSDFFIKTNQELPIVLIE